MTAYQGAVFVFEGRDCDAYRSIEDAAGSVEAVDVDNDEYDFFGVDGTVITASTTGRRGSVLLAATDERRPEELRQRLGEFIASIRPGSIAANWDERLADDPAALATVMTEPLPGLWQRLRARKSHG